MYRRQQRHDQSQKYVLIHALIVFGIPTVPIPVKFIGFSKLAIKTPKSDI